jgi:nucleoside-diphosphate-sugar epimerase
LKVLVTGCAGFIGSHLAEKLVREGHDVLGIDSFTTYYDPAIKHRNLKDIKGHPRFTLTPADLGTHNLSESIQGVETVFHLAAQPGVRASWGNDFGAYVENNVLATQRLLEAVKELKTLKKFIYASSSSVYGETSVERVAEEHPVRPFSPYGVTKLAAENLCSVYARNYGIRLTSFRFFSVYGPRQRPDMAFARLISAVLTGNPFTLYGDGSQQRDFTFVEDVVDGLLAAVAAENGDSVFNLGGGEVLSMNDIIRLVQDITGKIPNIESHPGVRGDVKRTSADISRIQSVLGFEPKHRIREGLSRQIQDIQINLR